MKRWRAIPALALALALLLTGCGRRSFYEALEDIVGPGPSGPASPEGVWRADVDYADMDPGDFTQESFRQAVADFDAITREGGDEESFRRAEDALQEGVYGLYTAYVLLRNASYADTGDGELSDRAARAMEAYLDAYDEFMLAHRRLAESENRDLLKTVYTGDYIAYFKGYEAAGGEEDELNREESELLSRYYALAGDTAANAGEIREIFLRLVELRRTIAELEGYDSYAQLAYSGIYARSYSPREARSLWEGAREIFAPLVETASDLVLPMAEALEADGSFDCSPESVLAALGRMARGLSPELEAPYEYLTDYHLYDISQRPEKAGIGFTTFLYAYNEPFIFNAPSGTLYDYVDTAHEFGHFTSYYFSPSELIFGLADNDLSELQSQGMSVAMSFLFPDLFGESRGRVMRDCVLLELAVGVVDGAMYDEFQQRVYEEEDLTAERIDEIFAEVYLSYGYEPYDGYEREWMEVAHNFETPFYYVSYAVSALGALEINQRCEEDFASGVEDLLEILRLDPEAYYYTDALEQTGLSDIFDGAAHRAIAAALARSLGLDAGAEV